MSGLIGAGVAWWLTSSLAFAAVGFVGLFLLALLFGGFGNSTFADAVAAVYFGTSAAGADGAAEGSGAAAVVDSAVVVAAASEAAAPRGAGS